MAFPIKLYVQSITLVLKSYYESTFIFFYVPYEQRYCDKLQILLKILRNIIVIVINIIDIVCPTHGLRFGL